MNLGEIESGVEGRFKIEAHRCDEQGNEIPGSRRVVADWFKNLITNNGLDRLASGGFMARCDVGTGSATPQFTDTEMQTFRASVGGTLSTGTGSASSPYYTAAVGTYMFGQGAASGNLTEIGVGPSSGSLFSRALIQDGAGNPTTVTVLSTEYLTVTYEFRLYPSETDIDSTQTIEGVSTAVKLRSAGVTGTAYARNCAQYGFQMGGRGNVDILETFSGDIGAITAFPVSPSGSHKDYPSYTYTNGTYYLDKTWVFGINQGNANGGVKSLGITSGNSSFLSYPVQMSFTPVIAKNNTKQMTVVIRYIWARR